MININNKLTSYIEYIIQNINGNGLHNIEFEIRFGKYGKISSNINLQVFNEIKLFLLSKKTIVKYSYINDILYKSSDYRKRIVYESNNDVKKIFESASNYYNIQSLELIKNNIIKLKPFTKYIKKEKIFSDRNNIFNNVKIDLVNELSYDNIPNNNNEIKSYRHKFRCSIYSEIWIYDLSILLYTDAKTNKSNIFYEVEMELNIDKIKKKSNLFNIIYESSLCNISNITNIINCISPKNNINYDNLNSIHNSVSTLERKNIDYLKNAKYAVCDKADGERKFIYIDNIGNMFHINPTEELIENNLIGKINSGVSELKCCLLDGELIEESTSKNVFYGFDILFYNNADCRSLNLPKRLTLLNTCISLINKAPIKYVKNSYNFSIKKFYLTDIGNKSSYIWNNKNKLFPYNLDGLIFTPINSSYIGYLPILKWKDKHSIDVRILYNRNDDFTEFYSRGYPIIKKDKFNPNKMITINEHKTNKGIFYKSRVNIRGHNNPINEFKDLQLINSNGILGIRGKLYDSSGNQINNMEDIIEVEFLYNEKKWIYLRKRNDKDSANAYLSILSVLNAIVDNITTKNIKSIKYKPSLYEKVGNINNNCFSDIGFNFIESSSHINKFYSYCANQLFSNFNSTNLENILILGCNKQILCGLYLYITNIIKKEKNKKINIIIIENNCLEVFGEKKSEGYIGLNECYSFLKNKFIETNIDKFINMKIIWTDSNIFQIISDKDKSVGFHLDSTDQKQNVKKILLSEIFNHKFDIIYINVLEYIYFNKKECSLTNKFDNVIINLKKMMKETSILIGLFLSSVEINKELTNKKCIVLNNNDMHPLYKLYKFNNLNKENKLQLVQIKRSRDNFFNEYQPLLTDTFILDTFIKKQFKKINCNSIKSLYPIYIKSDNLNSQNIKLTDYDLIIAKITKYIIFK